MIHHETTLSAPPARVFAALTDPAKYGPATEGTAFTLFGGAIEGRTIHLVPDERVVQAWRVKQWPAGHYSIVRFTLAPEGSGTKFAIDHDAYPPEHHDHLKAGWFPNYIEPLGKL
jgi:activator of HSP90 ATPase